MKFCWAAKSCVGGRSYNEDRVLTLHSREAVLLVVADGMGGHLHGELASQMVIDTLSHLFALSARPRIQEPGQFLLDALHEVQHSLVRLALSRRFPEVPSTTVVVALVQDSQLYCAWAGDSRLYLLEQAAVSWRTQDHSTVQRLLDKGLITEDEALTHPERNRIYSCLGGMDNPMIAQAGPLPLSVGSTLFLCSDGLWSQMSEMELARALNARALEQVVPALLQVAERRAGAGSDNLSVAAMVLLAAGQSGAGVIDSRDAPEIPDAMMAALESEMLASGRNLL
ncbi:PP2C family protein-serine/threonine phosphatase [Craterilacuibacter sp.]|uniref:PP2C family protein-serine/threonine phosphatase n=1 Tax=Craterilacuibacter sp. TaxID=2870909 RepID=UPI003F2BF666